MQMTNFLPLTTIRHSVCALLQMAIQVVRHNDCTKLWQMLIMKIRGPMGRVFSFNGGGLCVKISTSLKIVAEEYFHS